MAWRAGLLIVARFPFAGVSCANASPVVLTQAAVRECAWLVGGRHGCMRIRRVRQPEKMARFVSRDSKEVKRDVFLTEAEICELSVKLYVGIIDLPCLWVVVGHGDSERCGIDRERVSSCELGGLISPLRITEHPNIGVPCAPVTGVLHLRATHRPEVLYVNIRAVATAVHGGPGSKSLFNQGAGLLC